MDKLRALTRHLIERNLVNAEQLDSWAEQVNLTLIWKLEEHGLYMGDMRYRAIIVMERFAGNPSRLMALLGAWLVSHDPDRHLDALAAPTFDIEQLDADLADVEMTIDFLEPQYLAQDNAGEIEAFDTTWSAVPFDLWVAEQGAVSHAP